MRASPRRTFVTILLAILVGLAAAAAGRLMAADGEPMAEADEPTLADQAVKPPVTSKGVDRGQATEALDVHLPTAKDIGTPKHLKPSPTLEPYSKAPRPAFLVPKGCAVVSRGKPVTSSDTLPIIGDLEMVTDGDKEAGDGHYVELGPRVQWVQIDLKARHALYAVLVWHQHAWVGVYHDVVVQVSDDPDFIAGVTTVYNNDFDNSSGLGIGKDLEYVEDNRGRLVDAAGVKGRFVRLYSAGNTLNDQNEYIEVEVHGKPAD